MKKQIMTKVLFACFIMAMSGFVLNLQAQDNPIVVEFTNPDDLDIGSSNDGYNGVGLGGSSSGAVAGSEQYWVDDPYVEFAFTIGATGQIGLDVITPTTDPDVVAALDAWDDPAIGATTNADLYGKSFSLILTAESRMQLGVGESGNKGGIGVRGKNQRRIDDEGENNEWMQFELTGDVGIDFVRFGYNDVSGEDNAHAVVIDWDTRGWHAITDGVDGDPHPTELYIPGDGYDMRYFTDILRFTTEDSIDTGYKLWSLEFNVVAAEDKPPAVMSTTPPRGDSLTFNVADDLVIEFDASMDQPATAAAVSINPDVVNRADAWSAGVMGDVLTISYDNLEFATWYTVVVGPGTLGTNGLNILAADTFKFKTLPQPPSVVSTFPANLDEEVPIDSPISIEFSKSMVPDSVENAISFIPELTGLSFVWSEDNKTVFISAAVMNPSEMYFGTVEINAIDDFGTALTEPYIFAFTTSIATSLEYNKASDVVIYPNPAKDMLQIRGMDVASVKIYNLTGQMVKEVQNSTVVNVSDIETGIYVIDVKDRQDKRYKQMILIK